MFNIHKIALFNFRTYKGSHEFKFPIAEGLYFFTGENNTALGSNGAGKSTLLDAIVWVLYGRTARGLKGNEAISWGATTCQVTLELTIGRNRFKVKRSQKPNSLFLDDKPVDQKELEKHLRLNCEAFLYSVINTQFGVPFLALSPSEKLNLFSDIMELDFWLQKSKEASKLANEQEFEIARLQNLIARSEGQRDTASEDIAALEANVLSFSIDKEARIGELSKHAGKVHKEFVTLHQKLAAHKEHRKHELDSLERAKTALREAEIERDNILNKITAVSTKRAELSENHRQVMLRAEELTTLYDKGGNCPTCLQHVDLNHLNYETKILNKQQHEAQRRLKDTDDVLRLLTSNLVRAKTSVGAKSLVVDEVVGDLTKLDREISNLGVKTSSLNQKLDDLDAQLDELVDRKNPHAEMLSAKKAKLEELVKLIADSTKTKHVLEEQHSATSFWVGGFKRVRLFIIEQAFRTLEIEVNNSLAQLGMPDWQISFDIERENKSGGVTKGFVVFVKSPANKEPVRWENWSGGETQRLQLAGDLGLANLIMQRAGLTNTVEFYDEPSTHLSQQGMVDLANMLHDRAITEGKRIWIVDHTAITNFGEFEGIITARKSNHGSTITYNGN